MDKKAKITYAAPGWSVNQIAAAIGGGMAMLMRYETVSDVPTSRQDHPQSLRVHLKAAGIEFIGAPEDRSRIRIGRSW